MRESMKKTGSKWSGNQHVAIKNFLQQAVGAMHRYLMKFKFIHYED